MNSIGRIGCCAHTFCGWLSNLLKLYIIVKVAFNFNFRDKTTNPDEFLSKDFVVCLVSHSDSGMDLYPLVILNFSAPFTFIPWHHCSNWKGALRDGTKNDCVGDHWTQGQRIKTGYFLSILALVCWFCQNYTVAISTALLFTQNSS